MKKKIFMFFLCLTIWIGFTGNVSLPVVIPGILISFIFSYLFADNVFKILKLNYGSKTFFKKLLYIIIVSATFIYDAYTSAIKVTRHVFEIKPSFSPGIVKIKTELDNIAAITTQANLITLTPGTLVLDYDVLDKNYYIHWIDVKTEEEAEIKKNIIGKHEEWINNIFS